MSLSSKFHRYADVEHAVDKVTSGYRLVLTYNLLKGTSTEEQSAAAIDESQLPIYNFLLRWKESSMLVDKEVPKLLCYALDHQYTDANLRLNHLKGRDALIAKSLCDASQKSDFTFLLANMELQVSGACEDDDGYEYGYEPSHSIIEEADRSLELKLVVRADGSKFARDLSVSEEDLVQENFYEDRSPDEEDYEGLTGNEGASATNWYRDSCLVLMPRYHHIDFLFKSSHNGANKHNNLISRMTKDYQALPTEVCRREITQLCKLILGDKHRDYSSASGYSKGASNDTISILIKAASRLGDLELFKRAAHRTTTPHHQTVYKEVGIMLQSRTILDIGVGDSYVSRSLSIK